MKIKDFALQIKTGTTPLTSNVLNFEDAKYNWFTPGDFSKSNLVLKNSNRKISQFAVDNSATIFKAKTVLITCIGEIGNSGILQSEGSSNQQITGVLVNEAIINPYLFNYLIIHNKQKIKDKSNQAVVSILNNKNLKEIELSFPKDLETQNKIVAILDKAKSLIDKREQTIQLFDELLRATFLDMFGDPVKNEKGWKKKPLKEFGSIITGNTPPRANKEFYNDNFIEWIKTNNIIRESLFLSKAEEYLSEKGFTVSRYVNENALLVTCIAGSLSSIGRSAISNRKVAFNQQINAIVPNKEVSVYFLYWMMKISDDYIHSFATKGMKRLITKGVFEKIEFIKPDYNLQKDFEKVAINANNLLSKLIQSKTQLENLLNGLSQMAFNGELAFNEAVDVEVLKSI